MRDRAIDEGRREDTAVEACWRGDDAGEFRARGERRGTAALAQRAAPEGVEGLVAFLRTAIVAAQRVAAATREDLIMGVRGDDARPRPDPDEKGEEEEGSDLWDAAAHGASIRNRTDRCKI